MIKFLKKTLALMIATSLIATSAVFAVEDFVNNSRVSAEVVSEKKAVLANDISASDTTLTLEAGSTLVAGLALLGNEIVTVSISSGATTIAREKKHPHAKSTTTTASAHDAGSEIRNIKQNVDIKITPTASLSSTDKVIISVPDFIPISFGDMGTASTVASGTTIVKDENARTFTISGLTSGSQQVIKITDIIMPQIKGQHTFSIEIRTSGDTLIESGAALIQWGNLVLVKAIIQPALVFTLDKTNIEITANPSISEGEDFSQRSVLNVKTNSLNGYKIFGKLQGKKDNSKAQLDSPLASNTKVIASGDARTSENVFSYVAYNGDGSEFEQPKTTSGRNLMTSPAIKTKGDIENDISNSSLFAVNDAVLLPAKNGSAGQAMGTGNTELGFDSYINSSFHTVYYLLNVDYELPSGNYEGVVTYTAVPSF